MSTDQVQAPPIKPASSDASDFPTSVTLANGQEVPVGLPPGMDPQQAKMVLEFMKKNPEQAMQTVHQMETLMKNPSKAQSLMRMQAAMANTEFRDRMSELREDPELKSVFQDIAKEGPQALDKYWNDSDLMSKISQKMSALQVKAGGKKPVVNLDTLHGAAKAGDVDAIRKLLKEGADIHEQDARGISPLGVSVGFNKVDAVKELLKQGANVEQTDKQGNTVMHYAAGYGRLEVAKVLLKNKAKIDPKNNDGQTPLDVATLNREVMVIEFLKGRLESEERYV